MSQKIIYVIAVSSGILFLISTTAGYTCNVPDDWLRRTPPELNGTSGFNWNTCNKWPGGIVKYELHSSLSAGDRVEVQKAFEDYHKKTCIRFQPRSGEAAYTSIENDPNVCGLGHVCRTGGHQFAKFGGSCRTSNVMVHELGHNLGYGHEQSRSDRDNYLSFPGCSANNIPGKNPTYNLFNTMYDYASQMHYQCNWCPGGWPKITSVQKCGSDATTGLSVIDANKINDYYDCGGCLSYRFRNFEKLTSADRAALFAGGNDPDVGTTYICRGYHPNGDIIPGVYNLKSGKCYVPIGGGEYRIMAGDVLTRGGGLGWTSRGVSNSIPLKAIAGGRTKEGEYLYIARATVQANGRTATVPGKVHANYPSHAFVSYQGREFTVSTFQFLVCN